MRARRTSQGLFAGLIVLVVLALSAASGPRDRAVALSSHQAGGAHHAAGIASHSATWLADGALLVAGGAGAGGITGRVEIVDRAGDVNDGALVEERAAHAAVLSSDGQVLITGGANAHGVLDTLELVDPATGQGTRLAVRLPRAVAEHAATGLADGRVLVTGGRDGTGRPVATVQALDLATGHAVELLDLHHRRAGHTATLLSDGAVLITGGHGDAGVLETAEVWDATRLTSAGVAARMTAARTGHTATLLPSGDVLMAGGVGPDGHLLASIERFDAVGGTFRKSQAKLARPRSHHSATLLPTGEVLVWGGAGAGGTALFTGEIIDPRRETTRAVAWPLAGVGSDRTAPALVASDPADGATGVSTSTRIALRFSEPLAVTTRAAARVRLTASAGAVAISVVPAESGVLLFITPSAPLRSGTKYTLRLEGLTDTAGLSLASTAIRFTTSGTRERSGEASGSGGSSGGAEGAARDDREALSRDPYTGKPVSPWQKLPPLQAPPGVTALAGQALQLNGRPLADVTLKIGERAARTDHTGRFLLSRIGSGRQVLLIDGRSASRGKRSYGVFEYGLEITARQTHVLSFTIWMPELDMAHTVPLPSPTTTEVVVTNPNLPGLEVRIPPNTVLWDHEGQPVRQMTLTPIPLDQPPFPLPPNVNVPLYFTAQPGAAYVQNADWVGARIVYPNRFRLPTGTPFDFWHYDPDERGWFVYGQGKVTADRRQVVPDPGVAVYEFTGAMVAPPEMAPGSGPRPGDPAANDADPVNLGTGLFVLNKTDLVIQDVLPISLVRTYRPGDSRQRAFGIGATHPYDIFLVGNINPYTFVDLILPDGGRIHYHRISPGFSFSDAVYQHTATPTTFYGSKITWAAPARLGWNLTFRDGTVWEFPDGFGALKPQQAALSKVRDRFGNTLTLERNLDHQLTRITSPNGRWLQFSYDVDQRITQIADQLGRTVSYLYDTGGRLWQVINPNGSRTEYTYDDAHQLLTIKDKRGVVVVTNQYENGRVTRQTLADQGTYQFAYTLSEGAITQTDVTDPRGVVRRVTFNAAGYLLSDTRALGRPEAQTTTYVRRADNLIESVTDALGRQTAFTYDAMGNVLTITRLTTTPSATTSRVTYEPCFFDTPSGFCRVQSVVPSTATSDGRVTFSYSGLTQATITDARGQATTISYNSAGQPTTVLTPLGPPAIQYGYTTGDLTSLTDRLGRTTTRTYDAVGRMVSQTDPSGRTTSYLFDAVNRLVAVGDAGAGVTRLTYNAIGKLLSVTDARGNVTTYSYDAMGRLQTRTDPLGKHEGFEYDGLDNLTRYTDRKNQATTFAYDALNRRTGTTGPGYTAGYTWDAGNRVTRIADSVGGTIDHAYDLLDRLTTETTARGAVGYQYDVLDRRTQMTVPGQLATTYTWDPASRLTQITQGLQTVTLAYDNANRRTLLTLPNGVATEYQYDAGSRLTALIYRNALGELGRLTYGYDAQGNRAVTGGTFASTLLPDALTAATYNAGNRQTAFGAKVLDYDDNGSLTRITQGTSITALTWDSRNRLTALSAPGPTTAAFAYDALGRRASKTINDVATQFQYDGVDIATEIVAAVPIGYLTGPGIDEPLVRGGLEYFLADGLGSVIRLTTPLGTLSTAYSYEPFGRSTADSTPSTNALQYTARENDGTGLQYSRARYYSPTLQRFISEDPIGFGGGDVNLYAYVRNNPTGFTDPSGLCSPDYEPECLDFPPLPPSSPPALDCPDSSAPGSSGCGGSGSRGSGNSFGPSPAGGNGPPPPMYACIHTVDDGANIFGGVCGGGGGGGGIRGGGINRSLGGSTGGQRSAQDKRLTPGEIKKLQDAQIDIHVLKGRTKGLDLFKDRSGNIIVKPKSGKGPGEETGLNINDF